MEAKTILLVTTTSMMLSIVASASTSSPILRPTGPRCGQLICKEEEYCSEIDNRCAPCSVICDNKGHNFDLTLCSDRCHDYLYDLIYVRKENYDTLKQTVERLETSDKWHTIVIVILLIVILGAGLLLSCKCPKMYGNIKKWWTTIRKRCSKKKNSSQDKIPPALRVVTVDPTTSTSPATLQPLNVQTLNVCSSRQPAEDSSLDNSYVNVAMTPSPNVNESRMPQS